jgi:hypothetical protein
MAVGTGAYGTNASNAVSYGLGAVSGTVTSAGFNTLITTINAERARRGTSTVTLTLTNPISHNTYNALKSALEVAGPAASSAYNGQWQGYNSSDGNYFTGNYTPITYDSYGNPSGGAPIYAPLPPPETVTYPQAGAPSGSTAQVSGNLITAQSVNDLVNEINAAGAVCTCNCNYCTCNCNYCTCNCNYSCTCNCNYSSDIRLKTDIESMGVENGLHVYTWSYVWNKSKRFFGVMAQDLIGTKYESALNKDASGYYFVDYSQLPVNFREV